MTAGDVKIRTGNHQYNNYLSGVVMNGADDYIQIDAIATDEAGLNNLCGTIAAWVNVPDITNTFAVLGVGVAAAISYVQFSIKAGKLNYVVASAGGGATICDVVSTNVVITPHKWHHVCVVQNGVRPTFYVDGVAVAMTDTTATTLGAWMNTLATWDKGAIGQLVMNGTTTLDFMGGMAYVKYSTGTVASSTVCWNADAVKAEYDYFCGKGTGTGTAGQYASWTLQGNLTDTINAKNGAIVSDVQYDSEYSELTSKLRLLAPLVADDICIVNQGNGAYTAVLVTAA